MGAVPSEGPANPALIVPRLAGRTSSADGPTILPMSHLPISAPQSLHGFTARVWTSDEWARIQQGHVSRDMDDKWDLFVEGDTLFAHRSWTGFGVYSATFIEVEGGLRVSEVWVESDPERYRRQSDAYDLALLEILIRGTLLGEEQDPELMERWRAALPKTSPSPHDLPAS